MKRVDLPTLRAALWAQVALVRARRALRRGGLERVSVSAPPKVPATARRGVHAVLRRQPHTCLERALVLQTWEAAYGNARDVVIGVAREGGDFTAHAWLAGDPDNDDSRYHELMRLPAS
jgi:Transglutaminase-like superfamily